MKIQLIGPITGTDDYEERFSLAAYKLKRMGYEVVNPVLIGKVVESKIHNPTHEDYMNATLASLNEVDGFCRLEGWENSYGSLDEIELAESLGLVEVRYRDIR